MDENLARKEPKKQAASDHLNPFVNFGNDDDDEV